MRYNVEDGKGYFILGMTYCNALEAREAIAKYAVAFGYKVKLNLMNVLGLELGA